MELPRSRLALRVRLPVEDRVFGLWSPDEIAWSRAWLVRERAAAEVHARRLALVAAAGAPDGITVEAEVAEGAARRRGARFLLDVARGRLWLGSSDSDGAWLALAPGRWSVDVERTAARAYRVRLAPSVSGDDTPAAIGELAPFRTLAMERLLDGAARAQAAGQRAFDERAAGHDRWEVDQERGEILLARGGERRLAARCHAVGTLGDGGGFRWAWANASLSPSVAERSRRARALGVARDLAWLTAEELAVPVADVRRLVALAARAMGLGGVYPAPYERGVLYVAVEDAPPAN